MWLCLWLLATPFLLGVAAFQPLSSPPVARRHPLNQLWPHEAHEAHEAGGTTNGLLHNDEGLRTNNSSKEETLLSTFKLAPAITVDKFISIQTKRVCMEVQYTGGMGYKAAYTAVRALLKKKFPDVIVGRRVLALSSTQARVNRTKETKDKGTFRLLCDGRVIYQKPREKDAVYLKMSLMKEHIARARRKRRPEGIVYGDAQTYTRNKQIKEAASGEEKAPEQ
ncbi:unnamed protein product [Chrysoparadoxa australica]